jgi:5-methylcytosine-specific restriction endonuclease McrBC regulatory subunit McrC
MLLELTDDILLEGKKCEDRSQLTAVEEINKQVDEQKIKTLSLTNSIPNDCLNEHPIWHAQVVDEGEIVTKFYTSHYIGFCSVNGVDIVINPRFGLFNHLISYACNIYVPNAESNITSNKTSNNYWLIALLWKAVLQRAIAVGQIPKEYKTENKNLRYYKGRLDIAKQIRVNLTNASRFYCSYRKLTSDNTINRAIRYAYKILCDKKMGRVVNDIREYDDKLAMFGVSNSPIDISDIENIKYTRMTEIYRPVMQFCKAIIQQNLSESSIQPHNKTSVAYFIDMAELWEMYLLKKLQVNFPDYEVYSPNLREREFLMEDKYREVRPDLVIADKNTGNPRIILDAKYKHYTSLGNTSRESTVSREDLYQMTTYLHRFMKDGKGYGIFVSPVNQEKENDVHKIVGSEQSIGLVNLNLCELFDDKQSNNAKEIKIEIEKREEDFINKIQSLLES